MEAKHADVIRFMDAVDFRTVCQCPHCNFVNRRKVRRWVTRFRCEECHGEIIAQHKNGVPL